MIKPEGSPNRWCKSLIDPYPYDVVTGDPFTDREIARQQGSHPQPWWWRLLRWWGHTSYHPFEGVEK